MTSTLSKLTSLLSALTIFSLSACTSENLPGKIDEAEEAVRQGQYDRATAMCDALTASDDTLTMSAHDFFRIATIYAIAADKDVNNAENMARAARWIKHAQDSVSIYMQQLPVDEKIAITTAIDVSSAKVGELDEFIDPEDPAYIDTVNIHNDHLH
jgi:hypothetical protein